VTSTRVALARLAAALAAVAGVLLLPRGAFSGYAGVAAALAAATALARVPLRRFLRRLLAVEPFALGAALLSLLPPGGPAAFAALLVRSTLCLGILVLFSLTTPFTAVLSALRRLRVPALLVTTLALTHRYLFVLLAESSRLRRARRARTLRPGRRFAWRAAASVAGRLFVRCSERAERIFSAMRARGFPE
jgi:cobalt/nickel transport system permease protein